MLSKRPLKEYSSKRNLKKSGEPKAIIKISKTKPKKLIYIIHEHHATHLHYDLRLEMNGVLKSWAVPKEPPLKKGIKRLAVQVEDHPLSYAKFKGEIKEGYGKGIVKIYDNGFYELESKKTNKIVFILHGKKLKGKYVLLKTNCGKNKKGWLWFNI